MSVHSEPPAGKVPVKLVVAGGFGVGKTTFVRSLSDIEPLSTEEAMTVVGDAIDDRGEVRSKTTTTVAMDFGRVAIDEQIVLYLFGPPGQERFGFMWNDLARGALGAVVLVDTRRLADSFAAVDFFESREVPYVVAVNEFDGASRHPLDDVRSALAVPDDVPVVQTDARDRTAVKETVLCLLDVVLQRALTRAAAAPT